ncbi:zf-HC2 domain-containing protein [candidate division KSB1 bacterium]|nr:zf-HC2 domain-containing protein [candidate division KSB1 bacterium]
MIHPNDQNLQSYLDDTLLPQQKREIAKHLGQCPSCRQTLQIYRSMYQQLQEEIPDQLSPRFSSRVVRAVKNDSLGSVHMNLWHIFMVSFFVIVAINTALKYYDFVPMLTDLKTDFQGYFYGINNSLHDLDGSFLVFVQDFKLIVSAVLVLGLIFFIDILFLRSKHNPASSLR